MKASSSYSKISAGDTVMLNNMIRIGLEAQGWCLGSRIGTRWLRKNLLYIQERTCVPQWSKYPYQPQESHKVCCQGEWHYDSTTGTQCDEESPQRQLRCLTIHHQTLQWYGEGMWQPYNSHLILLNDSSGTNRSMERLRDQDQGIYLAAPDWYRSHPQWRSQDRSPRYQSWQHPHW